MVKRVTGKRFFTHEVIKAVLLKKLPFKLRSGSREEMAENGYEWGVRAWSRERTNLHRHWAIHSVNRPDQKGWAGVEVRLPVQGKGQQALWQISVRVFLRRITRATVCWRIAFHQTQCSALPTHNSPACHRQNSTVPAFLCLLMTFSSLCHITNPRKLPFFYLESWLRKKKVSTITSFERVWAPLKVNWT